jgi:hypothetical protein
MANNIEVNNIGVHTNIQFHQVNDPANEGMTVKIGQEGKLTAEMMDNPNVEWKAYDSNDLAVGTSYSTLISLAIDQDIAANEGTFGLYFTASNSNRFDETLTINFVVGGTSFGTATVVINGDAIGQNVSVFNVLKQGIHSGATIEAQVMGDNGNVTILGSQSATMFKVTKVVQVVTVNDLLKVLKAGSALFKAADISGSTNITSPTLIRTDDIYASINVQYNQGVFILKGEFDVDVVLNVKGNSRGWVYCEVGGVVKESYYFEVSTTNEGYQRFNFTVFANNENVRFYLEGDNTIKLQEKTNGQLYHPAVRMTIKELI